MKFYVLTLFIVFITLPMFAQQQPQAKGVLDKTTSVFQKAGGVKADFTVQASNKGRSMGQTTGSIQVKGDKFQLKTPDVMAWFDGKTQWNYMLGSEEVNVSTPSIEELQGINPYALLSLYQKGFSYKMGTTQTFRGKSVYEVILTASNKKQDLSRLTLYVTKDDYQPVGIVAEFRNGNKSEITVTAYQSGLKYADTLFVFNKKQYPRVEVIDLR